MKTKDLDISFVNWLLERIKEPFLNGDIHTALLSSADGPKKQVAESRFRIPSRYPNADEYDVDIDEGGKVCRFDVPLANSDWMMDVPPVEYDDCKDKFFAFFEAVVLPARSVAALK